MQENVLNFISFEWGKGNLTKNWSKHDVLYLECEQVFFNKPLLLYEDGKHSAKEERIYALGKTDLGRLLLIVFTAREQLIRVILARDMSKKERIVYEESASL